MNADQEPIAQSQISPEEHQLLAGVEPRIFRTMLFLGIAGTGAFWLWRDWSWAAGFAIGAVLSALSFRWMKGAISAMAQAAVPVPAASDPANSEPRQGGGGVVARFVLRYALIGVVAYVIFRSSAVSLMAFFVGLFVAIAAILAEVAYQIYLGFRSP